MDTTFIYVLKDPETEEIRYVGKSDDPKKRFYRHLKDGRIENYHRASWIKSLALRGLRPVLSILDEVLKTEWPSLECAYIEFFREQGCDLVNATAGGEAGPSRAGRKSTLETRAKQSAALAGAKHPLFGKKLSQEHRAKLSAAHLGLQAGEKHPMFGKPGNRLGKKHSLETRAKMRAAKRAKKLSRS